jgi:hypothetical protein
MFLNCQGLKIAHSERKAILVCKWTVGWRQQMMAGVLAAMVDAKWEADGGWWM